MNASSALATCHMLAAEGQPPLETLRQRKQRDSGSGTSSDATSSVSMRLMWSNSECMKRPHSSASVVVGWVIVQVKGV